MNYHKGPVKVKTRHRRVGLSAAFSMHNQDAKIATLVVLGRIPVWF